MGYLPITVFSNYSSCHCEVKGNRSNVKYLSSHSFLQDDRCKRFFQREIDFLKQKQITTLKNEQKQSFFKTVYHCGPFYTTTKTKSNTAFLSFQGNSFSREFPHVHVGMLVPYLGPLWMPCYCSQWSEKATSRTCLGLAEDRKVPLYIPLWQRQTGRII